MSETEVTSDSPDSTDPHDSVVDYSRQKRRILILLLAYSALLGIIALFLPEEDATLDLIVGLPLLILAVLWCHADAAQRRHRMGRLMKLGLVLFFVLAFPIYLVETRGLRGFKTLLLTAILVAAMVTCMFAAAFATNCVGSFLGLVE